MTRRTYVYAVVVDPGQVAALTARATAGAPGAAGLLASTRRRYLTRTGAAHRVAVLADHGTQARIERSVPVTWGEA